MSGDLPKPLLTSTEIVRAMPAATAVAFHGERVSLRVCGEWLDFNTRQECLDYVRRLDRAEDA